MGNIIGYRWATDADDETSESGFLLNRLEALESTSPIYWYIRGWWAKLVVNITVRYWQKI